MTKGKALISVIIPTHCRADILEETITHLLSQKDVNMEIIVLNDDIHDVATETLVQKYPDIRYIKNSSFDGPSDKRKYGINIAKGKYLYTTDDDDYLIDEMFLFKACDIMEHDDALSFVSGNSLKYYEDLQNGTIKTEEFVLPIIGRQNQWKYMQTLIYDKPLSTAPTLFRMEAFRRIPYNEMYFASDSGLYLMALMYGDAYILDDIVSIYRIRYNNSNLGGNLPIHYVINTLKQYEMVYKRAKSHLENPKDLIASTYLPQYSLYGGSHPNSYNWAKVLLWGLLHCHGSLKVIKYTINKIFRWCGLSRKKK